MIEALFAAFVALGMLMMLLGSVGLVRFPDVYTRIHSLGLSGTLGIFSILIGSLIYFNGIAHTFSIKEVLILLVILFTGPVSTHMIAQAAYRTQVRLWHKSVANQLEEAEREAPPQG